MLIVRSIGNGFGHVHVESFCTVFRFKMCASLQQVSFADGRAAGAYFCRQNFWTGSL
jgi:hypothetical protein